MDLNIDQFIIEIENREAIWNMQCEEYSDRVQRVKQWEEIIEMFTDEDASAKEKRRLGKMLQKRWRTLRDAFVKQRRELAAAEGGSGTSKKLYKYYNQLLFLLPVIENNTAQNSTAIQDDNDTDDRPYRSSLISPAAKKIKKSDSTENIDSKLVNALKSALGQKTEVEDPDRQFMLSLVSDFKNVPQRLKPRVKFNILKCIMDAQDEGDCQQQRHIDYLQFDSNQSTTSHVEVSSFSNIPTITEDSDSVHSEYRTPPKVQRVYKSKSKSAQSAQKN